MTKQIVSPLRELRSKRRDFIKKSLTKMQIVRKIGSEFAKEILVHVRISSLYGEKRYLLEDIRKYLDHTKGGKGIFIELVGGQSCFLPPINKHRQGKLFIKS